MEKFIRGRIINVGQTMAINRNSRGPAAGGTLLTVLSAFVVSGALAMEPEYPAPTKASLSGEWAGYWRGKPVGAVVLFTLTLDQNLRGTIVRSMKRAVVGVYDIDETVVSSGAILIRAHDRAHPGFQATLEAKGGVWESDGWLDAAFTDRGNDVVFEVRLEKSPEALVRKLRRMLSAARKAVKAAQPGVGPDGRSPAAPARRSTP
ncbi:MAG: hypothetical protein JW904_10940 [Spirochaetales bacterium]|nr:hypothetical protein [Spirochaetales bacterium]